MKEKSFTDIAGKIRRLKFNDSFDMVVGIASGGIVPAYMIAAHLKTPLEFIWINFRNIENIPQRESPILVKPISFVFENKSILLVDDRIQSGKTLEYTRSLLKTARSVKTFSINGKADYYLFDEECFTEPWNI